MDLIIEKISLIPDFIQDVLLLLDSDIRRDIFIGFTGLLVALVIFIAEIISNQKNELSKRVMLYKTHIRENITFMVCIYIFMWFCSLFELSEYSSPLYELFYYESQVLLNSFILTSMYTGIKMFKISIKINSDSEYFGEELDEYVKTRIQKNYKNERIRYSAKLMKQKEESKNFFNESKIFSDSSFIGLNGEEFKPIYSSANGYIINFDYSFLNKVENKITGIKLNDSNSEIESQDGILAYFTRNIGDKINKGTPIAYYNKKYMSTLKNIDKALKLDKSHVFGDDELNLITNNLFILSEADDDCYDNNNMLYNYLDFLYKNNYVSAKRLFLDKIEDEYRNVNKNKEDKDFGRWLVSLSYLAYSNDSLEDYSYINNLITYLYYFQSKDNNSDVKKIAYNYANNFFAINLFSVKRRNDYRYYDNLMSNLFSLICNLIKKDRYDAVFVLFDNINFDSANYWDELSDFDIADFQFSIGIIYCLIIKYQQTEIENISDDKKKEIKQLIDITRNHFIGFYDCWDFIYNFKKQYNKKSNIQGKYDNLDFEFEDHEYINNWGGFVIGERTILKSMLYVFNVDDGVLKDEDLDLITKDDKYYYEDLLKSVKEGFNSKLEKIVPNNFDISGFSKILEKIIEKAKEEEQAYIKSARLDKKKLDDFGKILKETALEDNEFIKYIKAQNKTETLDEELKRVFGINELLPRELFLDTMAGHEGIAKNYGNAISRGITNEYIKKIETFAEVEEKPIEIILKELKKPNEFLMISDYSSYHHIKIDDKFEDYILIDGEKIEVLQLPKINGIILINKRYLPKIQYCLFEKKYSKKNVDNHIFYEIIDCSENEKVRKEIINHSDWIKEKGDLLEQEEYLKQKCRIRVYASFKIVKMKNSKAIKINKTES